MSGEFRCRGYAHARLPSCPGGAWAAGGHRLNRALQAK
ncbi:hypothetical protein BRPE64_ACDS14970 [Caballeronia insecticola]|uniref:Uncharacterized protein n=1 Tax=Caballeronia insecticola TaxID=758793 RepID=R4WWE3_9BURK|nr:hypothetical protein BRPE64_ACDS14970 [Caballeronia insecticola]